jgi:hypothetical protein
LALAGRPESITIASRWYRAFRRDMRAPSKGEATRFRGDPGAPTTDPSFQSPLSGTTNENGISGMRIAA